MNKKTLIIVLACVLAAAVVCEVLIGRGSKQENVTDRTGNSISDQQGAAGDEATGENGGDATTGAADATTGAAAEGDSNTSSNTGSSAGSNTGSGSDSNGPTIGVEIEDGTKDPTGSTDPANENSAVIDFDDLLGAMNG